MHCKKSQTWAGRSLDLKSWGQLCFCGLLMSLAILLRCALCWCFGDTFICHGAVQLPGLLINSTLESAGLCSKHSEGRTKRQGPSCFCATTSRQVHLPCKPMHRNLIECTHCSGSKLLASACKARSQSSEILLPFALTGFPAAEGKNAYNLKKQCQLAPC